MTQGRGTNGATNDMRRPANDMSRNGKRESQRSGTNENAPGAREGRGRIQMLSGTPDRDELMWKRRRHWR
jgi:hypothetical protein